MAGALLRTALGVRCQSRSILASASASKRIRLSSFDLAQKMSYSVEERGSKNSLEYRIFISKLSALLDPCAQGERLVFKKLLFIAYIDVKHVLCIYG